MVFSYLLRKQIKKWGWQEKSNATPFTQALTKLGSLIKNQSEAMQAAWQGYRSLFKPIPTTQLSYNLIRLQRFLASPYTWVDIKNYVLSTHSLLTIAHYGYAYIKYAYIPALPHIPLLLSPRIGSALLYTFGIRTIFRNGLGDLLTGKGHPLGFIAAFIVSIPELIANIGTSLYEKYYEKNPKPFMRIVGKKILNNLYGTWSYNTIHLNWLYNKTQVYFPATPTDDII